MKKIMITCSVVSLLVFSGCGDDDIEETPAATELATPTLTTEQEQIIKEYSTEEKDPLVELLRADNNPEQKDYLLNKSDFLSQWKEKKGVLIDLRTPGEIEKTPLLDILAKNFDVYTPNFAENFRNLDKKENYFIYCAHGNRSASVYQSMKTAGFENVFELKGGIEGK